MIQSTFVYNILDLLLDGDEDGFSARSQLQHLTDVETHYDAEGVVVYFDFDGPLPEPDDEEDLVLSGVFIVSEQDQIEAEAVLYFADGIVDCLEIVCLSGDYPPRELTQYTLTQDWGLGRTLSVMG
ncbi:hypothetical protein [Flavobacterium caeni]|uniref:Uncharacterized protein n=1 Tax=Flavobacterium caeni TaxID=490189 RepID=A0A1G5EQL6_9FLAO|nr:hypothetical protein [Flavobacterium caeni]SCY28960.1 hypothetical protein SAMN02927903_01131 [Flavobacterium caeni]